MNEANEETTRIIQAMDQIGLEVVNLEKHFYDEHGALHRGELRLVIQPKSDKPATR